MTSKY